MPPGVPHQEEMLWAGVVSCVGLAALLEGSLLLGHGCNTIYRDTKALSAFGFTFMKIY